MQQRRADVFKVAGKLFAFAGITAEGDVFVTFKASQMSFEMLKAEPGIRPAPYMASRGLKWLQWYNTETLNEDELLDYINQSYTMVVSGLSRKQQLLLKPVC